MGTLAKGSPWRVLVVDDYEDAADVFADAVRAHGHLVRTAHDGFEALAMTAEFEPDLVFLDIGLPGMDGYEVARRMRQATRGRDLVLVAVTGYSARADERRSLDAGFDLHLAKPVDVTSLPRLLDSERPAARH